MRKLLLSPVALLCFLTVSAQIQTPQASPAGTVSSTVGLTEVEINYFRPKVKGRQIFGAGDDFLVKYGQLWRTGANAGTKISFSTDVMIAGTKVEAGEYMILTTPNEKSWEFVLYGDPSIGGNMSRFKDEDVVAKTTVNAEKLAGSVETLTFNISDISEDNSTANIHMAWADASIKVPMEVQFDETVMKEIAAKTKVNPVNYVQAASYYFNAGKDLNQALEWVNLYLGEGENAKQFWNVHLKAQILAKLGKNKEAIAAANDSIEKAKANPGGDFGYIKRNEDLLASINGK